MQQLTTSFFYPGQMRGLIRILRPKQWVKNGFVLAPLIFSGQFSNELSVKKAAVAMLLFCIASSATYVLNDLHDVEQDRLHPIKSTIRPLASGLIRLRLAYFLLGFLYVLLFAAWWLVPAVGCVIGGYLLLNIAYTYALKHQPVIDIFIIAFGFVFRVYAGAVAIAVPVSSWMLITTLSLALYLAAVKRRQELSQHGHESRKVLDRYTIPLINRYAEMAATSALVFYSMFVISSRPNLVVTIPVVLFGLFRYWYVVEALDGGESPTDALLRDKPLLLSIISWILVSVWVIYIPN